MADPTPSKQEAPGLGPGLGRLRWALAAGDVLRVRWERGGGHQDRDSVTMKSRPAVRQPQWRHV